MRSMSQNQDYERDDALFAQTVLVQIDGRWHPAGDAYRALELLDVHFPTETGPSHTRAVAACESLMAGKMSPEGAQSTFVVAVMEAGLPFELHDEGPELMEKLVEIEAENGLFDVLMEIDASGSPATMAS